MSYKESFTNISSDLSRMVRMVLSKNREKNPSGLPAEISTMIFFSIAPAIPSIISSEIAAAIFFSDTPSEINFFLKFHKTFPVENLEE